MLGTLFNKINFLLSMKFFLYLCFGKRGAVKLTTSPDLQVLSDPSISSVLEGAGDDCEAGAKRRPHIRLLASSEIL